MAGLTPRLVATSASLNLEVRQRRLKCTNGQGMLGNVPGDLRPEMAASTWAPGAWLWGGSGVGNMKVSDLPILDSQRWLLCVGDDVQ